MQGSKIAIQSIISITILYYIILLLLLLLLLLFLLLLLLLLLLLYYYTGHLHNGKHASSSF